MQVNITITIQIRVFCRNSLAFIKNSYSHTLVVNLPPGKMPKITKKKLPSTSAPKFQPITLRGPKISDLTKW
jgi:hypothetical protein